MVKITMEERVMEPNKLRRVGIVREGKGLESERERGWRVRWRFKSER